MVAKPTRFKGSGGCETRQLCGVGGFGNQNPNSEVAGAKPKPNRRVGAKPNTLRNPNPKRRSWCKTPYTSKKDWVGAETRNPDALKEMETRRVASVHIQTPLEEGVGGCRNPNPKRSSWCKDPKSVWVQKPQPKPWKDHGSG